MADASDPKEIREALKSAKTKDLVAQEGLKAAMGTEAGRAWLYKTIMIADPGRNPFTSNALATAFNCGEINVTSQIMAEAQSASFELYLQMIKENKQ